MSVSPSPAGRRLMRELLREEVWYEAETTPGEKIILAGLVRRGFVREGTIALGLIGYYELTHKGREYMTGGKHE